MKQPSLATLPQYPLCKQDFSPEPFHQIMYMAIIKLVNEGVNEITEVEIENVVQAKPAYMEVLEDNNYIDFIINTKELCIIENFEYYYKVVRKFALLRELQEDGFDTTEFYDELGDEAEELEKFDKLSIQDILNTIELKGIKLRSKYDIKYVRGEMTAGENTANLITQFEQTPSFGAFLCSPYLTQLYQGWCLGHLLMESSPSGVGKALPNSTIIPTPNGWKRVDEVHVGDMLFDRLGRPTKVTGVFPQGVKEKWKVIFKDGRKACCCDEHLWSYWYKTKENNKVAWKLKTKSLKEINKSSLQNNDNSLKYCVPVNGPVEFEEKKFYVPPYIMGLILGDGSFRESKSNKIFSFSSPDGYLPNKIAKIMGWEVTRNSEKNYNWTFLRNGKRVWVREVLQEYPNLINAYSGDKYIPQDYLNGSVQQRLDLLNGLLDTDGHVGQNGAISFSTTSERMAKDIQLLCYSLGMKAKIGLDNRNEKYKSGYCAIIRISCSPEFKELIFTLPEKKNRLLNILNSKKRHESNRGNPIVKIEPTNESEEMTCFMVDNDEHLFLMNDYIVTHNTRMSVVDLCGVSINQMWNDEIGDFVENTNYQGPGLFIHTELQTETEINPMFLSCVSGVPYKHITMGQLTPDERKRVLKAGDILLENNMRLVDMADFTCQSIDRKIKECVESFGTSYVVFDYVQLNSAVTQEYRQNTAVQGREDLVLKNITQELKDMAQKYGVGIKTMSQLNGNEKQMEFPDESCFSGGKSQKNKLDAAAITLSVKDRLKEYKRIQPYLNIRGFKGDNIKPNVVSYVVKARFGEYADQKIKVWRYFDRSTFRNTDLFCTDLYDEKVAIPRPTLESF